MDRENRRTLIGVSIGHAAHDSWYGVAPVLLAALSGQMALSNADIGFFLLWYQAVSAATQPLFGRLAERIGGRGLAVGSILWTTFLFTLTLFAQTKAVLLICIALAGFGSGAWHPQGTVYATMAGGRRWATTAAAIFFVGGSAGGAFLGAGLGGLLLGTFGRESLLAISAITAILALTVVRHSVPRWLPTTARPSAEKVASSASGRGFWLVLAFLLLGIALRSLSNTSLTNYVPKYQQDLGVAAATYGVLMSAFLAANGVGGVLGGYLADKLGLQRILLISLTLSGLALFGFVHTAGLLSYALLMVSGLFLGPSHTLFVVAGQRQFPQRMAMISGIFLGFTFVSGACGSWLLGILADRVGLPAVLAILPWTLALAGLTALVGVPRHNVAPAPLPDTVAAVGSTQD